MSLVEVHRPDQRDHTSLGIVQAGKQRTAFGQQAACPAKAARSGMK